MVDAMWRILWCTMFLATALKERGVDKTTPLRPKGSELDASAAIDTTGFVRFIDGGVQHCGQDAETDEPAARSEIDELSAQVGTGFVQGIRFVTNRHTSPANTSKIFVEDPVWLI